jgi:hypothetical protein
MTTTVAQAHRQLVAEMDEAGDPPAEIAKKLGISVDRVEAILDQLDESDGRPAHQDDEHRAPAVEPVRAEPRPTTEPVVELHPVPEMPATADELTTEDLVMTEQQRVDIEALRAELKAAPSCGDKQGTYAGHQWHVQYDDMPPCDPCSEARREYDRDYYAKGKKAKDGRVAAGYAAGGRLEPGAAVMRPAVEATLTPPRAEWDPATLTEMRKDAVAFLLLPLSIPRLVAVADALELAYGPDLRVVEGPGGMWVLGRAS